MSNSRGHLGELLPLVFALRSTQKLIKAVKAQMQSENGFEVVGDSYNEDSLEDSLENLEISLSIIENSLDRELLAITERLPRQSEGYDGFTGVSLYCA
jgi:hypothetical protein